MKVLDTTVAIDHLRGHDAAVSLLQRLVGEGELIAASELVRFELLAGVRPSETAALEKFFASVEWLPVDEQVVRVAGNLARAYRPSYSGIGTADYIIAATAIELEAPILTTNVKHFPMFDELEPAYPR